MASQVVLEIEDKDDLNHRIQVSVSHAVYKNKATEHNNGIVGIVYVDIASW